METLIEKQKNPTRKNPKKKGVSVIPKQLLIENVLAALDSIDENLELSLSREIYSSNEMFNLLLDIRNLLVCNPEED
jgi:hypothetical protein